MPWARLDDQFPDHPKIEALSDKAVLVHVTALCRASHTRGRLSDATVAAILRRWKAPKTILNELSSTPFGSASPLWHQEPGGWRIHDWEDYQPDGPGKAGGAARAKSSARNERGQFASALDSAGPADRPATDQHAGPAGRPAPSRLPSRPVLEDSEKGIMRAPRTAPASAARGTPEPDPEGGPKPRVAVPDEPDPDWLAEVDRLRSTLARRDRRKARDLDAELRLAAARHGDYAGLPRDALRPAILRGLTHLLAAIDAPRDDGQPPGVQSWGRYFRHVVLAEAQNGAASVVQEQAEQHREDLDAAAILLLGSAGRRRA